MARSLLKLGPRKLRHFPRLPLCDTSIEPGAVHCYRQRLEAAAGAGRFSNATHQWWKLQSLVAADTDSAIELELEPTPCTTAVVVKPSVSVCELGPSASASPLASAMAELPLTNTSTSMLLSMSTFSRTCTSLAKLIANASRLPISSSCCSRGRTGVW